MGSVSKTVFHTRSTVEPNISPWSNFGCLLTAQEVLFCGQGLGHCYIILFEDFRSPHHPRKARDQLSRLENVAKQSGGGWGFVCVPLKIQQRVAYFL